MKRRITEIKEIVKRESCYSALLAFQIFDEKVDVLETFAARLEFFEKSVDCIPGMSNRSERGPEREEKRYTILNVRLIH